MSKEMHVEPRPYRLENPIQHYAWGTRDDAAYIPRLLGIEPEPGLPYAELWMGAHPSAPSRVRVGAHTVSLARLIERCPVEVLGVEVSETFGSTLPFLFKVLSAAESLSIQAHPNAEQAIALHARDPEHYPDPHHKPELAIAVSSLTALMGLRSYDRILTALARYPELARFVGEETCARLWQNEAAGPEVQRGLVRELLAALVNGSVARATALEAQLDALSWRLQGTGGALEEEEALFLDLRNRYAGADAGLFALFLLNLVHLEAGQGVYIGPGVPHAYLGGNIVECMANSDNVVRVGLTPKYRDAETLIAILDDRLGAVPILEAPAGIGEMIYHTPAREFQVSRWQLAPGEKKRAALQERPEILLILAGKVHAGWAEGEDVFCQGESMLLPACLRGVSVEAMTPATVFRAEVPR
jgi:mannose-6-phosphate isomerase